MRKIQELKRGNKRVLKNEPWLLYLYLTNQHNFNLEQINSIEGLTKSNFVLDYVERTLKILDKSKTALLPEEFFLIEETLKWNKVSKCGLPHIREK